MITYYPDAVADSDDTDGMDVADAVTLTPLAEGIEETDDYFNFLEETHV